MSPVQKKFDSGYFYYSTLIPKPRHIRPRQKMVSFLSRLLLEAKNHIFVSVLQRTNVIYCLFLPQFYIEPRSYIVSFCYHNANHNCRHHHRQKSFNRGSVGGQVNHLLWSKTKSMSSKIMKPTSPKVTCADQIKV